LQNNIKKKKNPLGEVFLNDFDNKTRKIEKPFFQISLHNVLIGVFWLCGPRSS
jgi:hypothetical protein